MDFRYTSEQLALQETLQRYIERDYRFEQRRSIASSAPGYSEAAWKAYAELGLLALPLPQEFGGLGGTALDTMVVMELVGRGLLLEPLLSTLVLSCGLIADAAPAALQRSLLPRVAAGELKLALGCYEAQGRYELRHVACRAVEGAGGWRLSGTKSVVLDAPSADYFLISARTEGETADARGIAIFLVAHDAPGLSMRAYPTHSGARAADLRLSEVAVARDALIGSAGDGLRFLERAVDKGNAALCGEAVGIMTALNEATLSYLKSRKQFGAPIGTFQALQHRMADMYIAAEQARSMAIIAAASASSPDEATRRRGISGAKAYIGQAARLVGQQAVQLHGGMGLVDELIVSHYFKRLTMIDLSLGDTDFHLARFSETLRPRI